MEFVSVFDIFKIGVGPSSSHTLGPWKAARSFVKKLENKGETIEGGHIEVFLFGSLSLTGKGHATDLAVIMGLSDFDPETVETSKIDEFIKTVKEQKHLLIKNKYKVVFDPEIHIHFKDTFLEYHANGMIFNWTGKNEEVISDVFYSVGGGFIVREGDTTSENTAALPYPFPIQTSEQLLKYCASTGFSISDVVRQNELINRSPEKYENDIMKIWSTMLDSMFVGCHTEGILPGMLSVKRRSAPLLKKLLPDQAEYNDSGTWLEAIRRSPVDFQKIFKWVSTFAISVNEVNAAFGRVVTAPTNGSAGVIPAVLMYYLSFVNTNAGKDEIIRFLACASEIGSIFKKGSTLSAAMGGCQAEIGVSSAMAAAGLTELLGGSPERCIIAAEIAMEHHLGMTCDPIGGLVQIPCIERNSMGAIKAINAAEMAIDREPSEVKVPLDDVVKTMWETAKDMNSKYKETSEAGLATTVNIIDC
ncbi:MAG: L-serine ammonia-lyase [Saprospiraceae bacterium]|nr:L-serine ammonia-lyase [Saprospiraceae bacterium]